MVLLLVQMVAALVLEQHIRVCRSFQDHTLASVRDVAPELAHKVLAQGQALA